MSRMCDNSPLWAKVDVGLLCVKSGSQKSGSNPPDAMVLTQQWFLHRRTKKPRTSPDQEASGTWVSNLRQCILETQLRAIHVGYPDFLLPVSAAPALHSLQMPITRHDARPQDTDSPKPYSHVLTDNFTSFTDFRACTGRGHLCSSQKLGFTVTVRYTCPCRMRYRVCQLSHPQQPYIYTTSCSHQGSSVAESSRIHTSINHIHVPGYRCLSHRPMQFPWVTHVHSVTGQMDHAYWEDMCLNIFLRLCCALE